MTHEKFMFDRSFDFNDTLNEEIEVIEEAQEEPEIIVPTFSEGDVEVARNEGFENGKVEALKEAAERTEKKIVDATQVISEQLDQLTSNQSLANKEIFRDAIEVSRAITAKLFPSINAEKGFQEIEKLIYIALGEILEEPRVKIQIHPALIEQLSERINQISENTHFEGRILIFANEEIEQGDCKIEWSSGGAERNVKDIMLEIDDIINTNLAITGEGYQTDLSSLDDVSIEPLTPPSGRSGESSPISGVQNSLNKIDQADYPSDDAELTVPKQEHETRSETMPAPNNEKPEITEKMAIDQHTDT